MALLNATQAQFAFTTLAAFGSSVESSPNVCSWLTADPQHQIRALGTGFAYSGVTPLSGTVTEVTFDLVDDDDPAYGFTDVTITGISVALTALVDPADPQAGETAFWRTLLAGNDTILAPLAVGGKLVGDFSALQASFSGAVLIEGGDDIFTAASTKVASGLGRGSVGASNALIGDGAFVDGFSFLSILNTAFVIGGDDVFNVSKLPGFAVIGDVQAVGVHGHVTGGADTVVSTINPVTLFTGQAGLYIGDVEINDGVVTGGADTITGSNFAFASERLVGDVRENAGTGVVAGGNDLLQGRAGQDVIAGDVLNHEGGSVTGGADRILGGGDSDIIAGDVLQSIGLQFVTAIPSGVTTQIFTTIVLHGGNDNITGGAGDDWIVGDLFNGDGVEEPSTVTGGNDAISGGDGDDMLYGDIGADFTGLLDAGGNDVLDGGLGDDLLDGQAGRDTASFAATAAAVQVDLVLGTAVGQGSDTLAGIEDVTGSALNDRLEGSSDANQLDGGLGADFLNGRGGNDTLIGGGGGDGLSGGDGNDALSDGAGGDTMTGGNGNDAFRLAADGNADTMDGGAGADTLDLSAATANVTVTFTGSTGGGAIAGGGLGADSFASVEVIGGSGAGLSDTLIGAGGTQVMFLRAGSDRAEGRVGDDLMAGEAGSDRLDGGAGNDILNGGTGSDTFVFSAALNAVNNVDEIEDFDTAADLIELAAAVFTGLVAGTLGAAAFVSGSGIATAQDASDRIIYDQAAGDLYFDADGTAAGASAIKFATLSNTPGGLAASDFVIV